MNQFAYQGGELRLFAQARTWKRYVRSKLRRYLCGDVLEVGAGIGSMTRVLRDETQRRWVCLEPDPALANQIPLHAISEPCEIHVGRLDALSRKERFDAIVYLDVLEHIEDDREELKTAALYLRDGGRIVVLSPAHQWLFSPFDASIGHFRRYDRTSLMEISPPGVRLDVCRYLDSAGLLPVLGNRLLLRHAIPTTSQILLWDRLLVPLSTVLDGLLGGRVGKSILAIWLRE